MEELAVARPDLDEALKRLTREGNAIRAVVSREDDVLIRYERRTEIREGV